MGKEYLRDVTVLGSVPSLGPVILFDDIEGVFKWTAGGTGAGYVADKSATVAYNGSAGMHLKSRVAGAAANDLVSAYRDSYQRPGKRYGVELIHRFEVEGATAYLRLALTIWDGTYKHFIEMRYDVVGREWEYWNSAGAFASVPGSAQRLNNVAWHRLYLSFDEVAGTYLKLISDGLELDISDLSYQKTADTGPVRLRCLVELQTVGADAVEGYFDDVLIMEI